MICQLRWRAVLAYKYGIRYKKVLLSSMIIVDEDAVVAELGGPGSGGETR
jgi:hypothetical protein